MGQKKKLHKNKTASQSADILNLDGVNSVEKSLDKSAIILYNVIMRLWRNWQTRWILGSDTTVEFGT